MADEAPKKPAPPEGLTAEEFAVIQKWIDDHWVVKVCPMCGKGHFFAARYILHPESLTPKKESTAPVGYFFVAMNCDNCFYTVLINAVPLGLWNKYQPDAK